MKIENTYSMKISLKEFKKIIENSVSSTHRDTQIIIKRGRFEQARNYLRNYAEDNGMYFVELDEFTDTYIGQVVRLYQQMADNNFAIIYLRMYDCVDYSQPHHLRALYKLYHILNETECNLQIVIDYHMTSKDTEDLQLPEPIIDKCCVWEVK